MVRPTPGVDTSRKVAPEPPLKVEPAAEDVLKDPKERARAFLELLGKMDHPDAQRDPLYALYQVAVDFRCSAHGYRDLYLGQQRGA